MDFEINTLYILKLLKKNKILFILKKKKFVERVEDKTK